MTRHDSPTSGRRNETQNPKDDDKHEELYAIHTGKTVAPCDTTLNQTCVPIYSQRTRVMHFGTSRESVQLRCHNADYTFRDYLVRERYDVPPARRVQLGDLSPAEQWSRHLSRARTTGPGSTTRNLAIIEARDRTEARTDSGGEFHRGQHPGADSADSDENERGTLSRGRIRGWLHPRPERRAEQLLRLRASHGSFIAIGWRESKIERSSTSTSWDPFPSLSLSLSLAFLGAPSPSLARSLSRSPAPFAV